MIDAWYCICLTMIHIKNTSIGPPVLFHTVVSRIRLRMMEYYSSYTYVLNFDFEENRPTCRYTRGITRHITKCMEKGISSSEAHVLADHQDSQILDTAAPRLDDRNSSFCFILLLVIKKKTSSLHHVRVHTYFQWYRMLMFASDSCLGPHTWPHNLASTTDF